MSDPESAWDDPNFVAAWNNTYGLDMRNAPIRGKFVFPWIDHEIGNLSGKRILDVGCGNGNLISHFRSASFQEFIGIDTGKAVVESARSAVKDPRVRFIHINPSKPYPQAEIGTDFDAVTSVFVVEEIPFTAFDKFCASIGQSLKPQGKACIFTNHPTNALVEDMTAKLKNSPNQKFPDHQGYFDREPNLYTLDIMNRDKGVSKKAQYHHKTIADIITAFAKSGLSVQSMVEVPRGMLSFADYNNHAPASGDIPRFAGFVFQKA